MIEWAKTKYSTLSIKYPKLAKVFRYLISGGTAAFTNIVLLYFFTDIVGIWYIISAIIAFIIAFVVSFILQKYWTFEDKGNNEVHRQAIIYFIVAATNLCLNTALLYCLVEYAGIHYLISQIISNGLIAFESFFVYQIFIFRKQPALS